MMSAGSVYETAATFGDLCLPKKPVLVLITVPQVKKRRQPTKHYVRILMLLVQIVCLFYTIAGLSHNTLNSVVVYLQ